MKTILTLLVLAVFTISGAIRADEPTVMPTLKAGKTLTIEEIGEMLDNLGFNPKPITNAAGELVQYNLDYTSGSWELRPYILWSKDKSAFWLCATILRADGKTPVPAEVLQQFLAENNNNLSGFCMYVQYKDGTGAYVIEHKVPNLVLTPTLLRKQMEQFSESIKAMVQARNKGLADAKAKAEATTKVAGKDTQPTTPIVP